MNNCCQGGRHHHHHRDHDHDQRPLLERPWVFISSVPHNGQMNVSPHIKAIKLIFGRDFNNDPGWVNAGNEIDMWQGINRVPIRIRRVMDRRGGHRVILVIPINPLLGGVTYKVRIKSLFVDRNGESFERCRLIVFTTGCRR